MEGAGSPVELNLMARDFVNLRPARRLGVRRTIDFGAASRRDDVSDPAIGNLGR